MSGAPRRLRDDPDFSWETGCDLADEAFAVGGYDLPAMKGAVLAEVQAPSAGAPLKAASRGAMSWGGAGLVVGGVLLVGGLLWAWSSGPSVEAAAVQVAPMVASPPAPASVPAVAPAAGPTAPAAAPEVVGPVGPAPVERVEAPAAPAMEAERSELPAEAEASPAATTPPEPGHDEPAPAPDAAAEAPPLSGLAAELAAFDAAAGALSDGRPGEAALGFEAYLATYPSGRLLDEAELGLLRARVELGDHEGVEVVAARLQERPSMALRRSEILRTRAENLVWLKRCDDAVALVASLPARERADVRRACRR